MLVKEYWCELPHYGETTLLRGWVQQYQTVNTCLSLDGTDNDPICYRATFLQR
jgi:hypothetical protein